MGPLPFSGEWVGLEVPASDVGLSGMAIRGMAFTLFNGQATWDYAGVFTPPRVIPNVLSDTSAEAEQAIRAAGFSTQVESMDDPTGDSIGLVTRQPPAEPPQPLQPWSPSTSASARPFLLPDP